MALALKTTTQWDFGYWSLQVWGKLSLPVPGTPGEKWRQPLASFRIQGCCHWMLIVFKWGHGMSQGTRVMCISQAIESKRTEYIFSHWDTSTGWFGLHTKLIFLVLRTPFLFPRYVCYPGYLKLEVPGLLLLQVWQMFLPVLGAIF